LTNATSIHAQRDTSVLVGGICDQIFELDITNRGKIMRTVPTGCSGITLFRTSQSNSRYLYTADDQVLKRHFWRRYFSLTKNVFMKCHENFELSQISQFMTAALLTTKMFWKGKNTTALFK
jgi:hypothetical protein